MKPSSHLPLFVTCAHVGTPALPVSLGASVSLPVLPSLLSPLSRSSNHSSHTSLTAAALHGDSAFYALPPFPALISIRMWGGGNETKNGMNDIEGKLALVTGASGGIGGACARQFAARNVHLALTYSSNRDKLAALVTELRASCPETLRISMHQVDLAYPEQIDSMFAEVQEAHKANVDILIVNAGYGKRIVNIWDIPLSEFDHTINVNLRASFLLARGVSRAMAEQRWGRIIFVSSIAAYGGGVNGCRMSRCVLAFASLTPHRLCRLERRPHGHDEKPGDSSSPFQYLGQRRCPGHGGQHRHDGSSERSRHYRYYPAAKDVRNRRGCQCSAYACHNRIHDWTEHSYVWWPQVAARLGFMPWRTCSGCIDGCAREHFPGRVRAGWDAEEDCKAVNGQARPMYHKAKQCNKPGVPSRI